MKHVDVETERQPRCVAQYIQAHNMTSAGVASTWDKDVRVESLALAGQPKRLLHAPVTQSMWSAKKGKTDHASTRYGLTFGEKRPKDRGKKGMLHGVLQHSTLARAMVAGLNAANPGRLDQPPINI